MPSLTTRPATPRNDAADRYSPDTAAALTSGEIRRDATRKSDVVRIAATPRAPISSVDEHARGDDGARRSRLVAAPRRRRGPARRSRGAAASAPARPSAGYGSTAIISQDTGIPSSRTASRPGNAANSTGSPSSSANSSTSAGTPRRRCARYSAGRALGVARGQPRRAPAAAGPPSRWREPGLRAGDGHPRGPCSSRARPELGRRWRGFQQPVPQLAGVPAADRDVTGVGVREQAAARVAAQLQHRAARRAGSCGAPG